MLYHDYMKINVSADRAGRIIDAVRENKNLGDLVWYFAMSKVYSMAEVQDLAARHLASAISAELPGSVHVNVKDDYPSLGGEQFSTAARAVYTMQSILPADRIISAGLAEAIATIPRIDSSIDPELTITRYAPHNTYWVRVPDYNNRLDKRTIRLIGEDITPSNKQLDYTSTIAGIIRNVK